MSLDTINTIVNSFTEVMVLKMYINTDNDVLRNMYYQNVNQHNTNLLNMCNMPSDSRHVNSGFDLYTPYDPTITSNNVNCIDFQVKCSAVLYTHTGFRNTGYYLYPRSSLSKTNLRLANSVGIIDSGYRGNIMGMFDYINGYVNAIFVHGYERIVQLCSPTLGPIFIELVNSELELGITERGENGFGSTGVL